jgi:hypothetical protein
MTLNDLETGFVCQSDGKVDSWRILDVSDLRGDCDDFACTALFIATGSLWSFWVALIFGSAKIHYGGQFSRWMFIWPQTVIKTLLGRINNG